MSSRREFLQNVLISGAGLGVSGLIGSSVLAFEPLPAGDPWIEARRILGRIKAPIFPRRDFPITRFGAVGNARADCTEAFAKAISACSRAGGGRVLVPEESFSPARHTSRATSICMSVRTRRFRSRPDEIPASGFHALGRHGVDELLGFHLCLWPAEHRDHG